MPTLSINGQSVQVGDDFVGLPPEQQNSTVDEIAKNLGMHPRTWGDTAADVGRFGMTAATRGLGALADFAMDPLAPARRLISPDLERVEQNGKFQPGQAAGNAVFSASGVPEYQPTTPLGRVGLAAAEGAVAGGPFGLLPGALTAAGGALGQGTMEATGSERLSTLASMAPMLGARPTQAAGRGIADRFAPYETQAARRLARDFDYDTAGGGTDINGMREAFVAPEAQGKPLAIADVAGPSVQGRGEAIANRPGPGAQIAETFLTKRDAGAGPRLLGDVADNLGMGESAYRTAQTLQNQQSLNATPLYEKAREANPAMSSPEISAVLETPEGRAALAAARTKMANAGETPIGMAAKPEISPSTDVFGVTAPGRPAEPATLSLQTLDYVKRAFDDKISAAKRAGENDDARIFTGLKRRLVDAIDKADSTGLYKQARDTFSGDAASIRAVEDGAQHFKLRPEESADRIAELSAGDKRLYLIGARDALAEQIAGTSSGGNEALRIVGNQQKMNQLRSLFDTDADFNAFIGRAKLESAMYRTMNNTLGNSRTFRRAAHAAADGEGGGFLGSAAQAGGALLAHEPFAALPALMRAARGVSGWLNRPSPQVNANIARMLFNGDPQTNAAALQAIEAARRPRGLLALPPIPAGLLTIGEHGR